jgi:hypothetical protein
MIRRAFWLGAGATAGILGYRRAAALGRRASAPLSRADPGPRGQLNVRNQRRGILRATRGTIRFARDVREGMDMYSTRHALPSGHASLETKNNPDRKDGR